MAPSAADLQQWAAMAQGLGPHVCENNVADGRVAQAFLRASPTRTYIGVAYSGAVQSGDRRGRRLISVLRGRSIDIDGTGNSTIPPASCDVLVADLSDAAAKHRQGLLVDLPNVLRRSVGGPKSLVIVHGAGCGSRFPPAPRMHDAKYRTNMTAWRDASRAWRALTGCTNRKLRMCSAPGEWCDRWAELVASRGVVNATCRASRGGRWCAGVLETASLCTAGPPWLEQPGNRAGPSGGTIRLRAPRGVPPQSNRSRRLFGPAKRSTAEQFAHHYRYYSAVDCGPSAVARAGAATEASRERVCLVFKNAMFEGWVGGVRSSDGVTFDAAPELVLPAALPAERPGAYALMTHNSAILRRGDEFLIVGGQSKPPRDKHTGVWLARGPAWRYAANRTLLAVEADVLRYDRDVVEEVARSKRGKSAILRDHLGPSSWRGVRIAVRGDHRGCVERRDPDKMEWIDAGVCEFDGRLSLVHFRGRYLLYARANPAARGQRFVQVASSVDAQTWGAFELIDVRGYAHAEGDVYFFAAQANPVDDGSLVALFPLVHRLRGCVGMALSTDGVRWSSLTPLLACRVYGERAVDHPVAGMVRAPGSREVLIYVQRDVPRIRFDSFTPYEVVRHAETREPKSRVEYHRVPEAALRRWTEAKLAELRAPETNG